MYKLPEKLTGINAQRIAADDFKKLCYSLQGLGLISVVSISEYEYPKNYYSAIVKDETGSFEIYCNCFVGVVGLGAVGFRDNENDMKSFISKPNVEAAILSLTHDYKIAPLDILVCEATSEHLGLLSNQEAKAVISWLPCKIGALLFSSYFD